MVGDGFARHTPTLTDNLVARCIVCDQALLIHIGDAIAQCTGDFVWTEVGDPVPDIVAACKDALDSWYEPIMIGMVTQFIGPIPAFWLALDGTTYNQSDYPELWSVIDAQYKNAPAGTFTLPDFSDLFIVGALGDYALGSIGGESVHTLTEAELPSHTHTYTHPNPAVDIGSVGTPIPGITTVTPNTPTGATGSGDAHENKPPYIAVAFGIFAGR